MGERTERGATGGVRLNEAQRETFRRDGVVKVPGAVDGPTVGRMLAAVDRWLASPDSAGGTGMDRRLYARDDDFNAFVFGTDLAALAADALGSERVRIYFDQLFVKPAGAAERYFHWHQDQPFWPILGSQVASTWVALTPATVATSALEFVAGSHRWDKEYRPYFGERSTTEDLNRMWPHFGDRAASLDDRIEAFEDHPERYEVIGFDVEPGDALLFSYRIVHRSRGNPTDRARVAVSYRWLGDDALWAPVPGADPVIGPEHTAMVAGSRIDDDAVFPVVFGPLTPTS